MATEDPGVLKQLLEWAWAVVGALVSVAWGMLNARIKKVEEGMETKADKAELDRQRDNISKIFDKIDGLKDDMNNKFDSIKDLILSQRK